MYKYKKKICIWFVKNLKNLVFFNSSSIRGVDKKTKDFNLLYFDVRGFFLGLVIQGDTIHILYNIYNYIY